MKMDYPPEVDSTKEKKSEEGKDSLINLSGRDSLVVALKKYDEESFISPEDFKNKFSLLLKNNSLYYEFSNKLEDLLNKSIDEEGIIEEYNYDHELEDQNAEIKKIINEKIDSYINEIIFNYESGLFQEKIKIISFLSSIYFSSLFLNNFTTREKISKFFNQILESEKEDSGNYYIFSHLKALFEKNEWSSLFTKISPDQYTTRRFVYDNEQNYGNRKDKTFISKKEDFEEISKLIILVEEQKKKKDELYKKVEDFFNKSENKNEKEIDFDYNSKEPVVLEYLELRDELDKNEKLLNSYFTDELTESYFRPNTKAEKYQNKFLDHNFFQYKSIRDNFKERTGFSLEETTIQEQYNYFEFTKEITNKGAGRFFNFLKIYGRNAFRTFLSIEQGGKEMGDKILTLGEKLQEDVVKKVFTKYGEIIDNVNKITEFTRTNFTKEIETNPEFIKKIEETLYIKGKQLLLQIYDDLNNEKEVNYEQIDKQLDRINADTITTFAIFKQAVKNGEKLPIESIEGSVFSKKEASDIGDNQQTEMLELYEINWKNHPDRDFVESLKSYFKTAFSPETNKQKNYFYTFEKDNNIRAFVRFEKQNDASFYASALNVDEASKNFGLGEAMMDEALTREAKEHILHASCRKDNPSNMRYFEKGFISRGFKKTNETEEFDLVWDENKNKDILAKQKSQGELIDMQNTKEIEIRKSKDLKSLHENIPEGKSLVRCFLNNGEWYAVYEKISDDYGINFGETK